ncbi:MAG: arginine--tRNA ligase [Deltaproteobacteria bacterium]|nr:arginine--tRNA ligase [Deltaproteobacteria bacterium]
MKRRLRAAIAAALQSESDLTEADLAPIGIEVPARPEHGDFAINAAMVLARKLRRSPREIAQGLAPALEELPEVERVTVAGPGFINVSIRPSAWRSVLIQILEQGEDFGRSQREQPREVMVEFVSANPTGPLHFGHGRGAVVGDVLARLLDFSGHRVQREFYVNDAGRQVRNLALSIDCWRRRHAGEEAALPEDGYHGAYVEELAQEMPPDASLEAIEEAAVEAMLEGIRRDLSDFGIHMDRFASERALVSAGRIQQAIGALQERGVLEEREGASWFRSDRFGDEKARVLIKQDGSNTYFATDIAYHMDKLQRGFDMLINVWGADHHGYVPRMKAALQALGQAPDALDVVLVQMVSLVRDGAPVLMSKRAGEITTLRQVFEEVGRDAARFFFLVRGPDSQMEFDLELAKRRSLDNPVFYVQYGHARLCSLLVRAAERGVQVPALDSASSVDLDRLVLPEEMRIVKRMSELPEVVRRAADSRAPHQLVYYLQELVGSFHSYYTAYGKVDPILVGEEGKVAARLVLVLALRQVLRNALDLLGVSAPERMDSLETE